MAYYVVIITAIEYSLTYHWTMCILVWTVCEAWFCYKCWGQFHH